MILQPKQTVTSHRAKASRIAAHFARTPYLPHIVSSRFACLWHDFTVAAATTVEAPGIRAAWHKGRPSYAVWVLRVQDELVQRRVSEIAEALGPRLIPEPDLHVTLAIAGFPQTHCVEDDDVSLACLQSQAQALQGWTQAVSFRIHGACSFLAAPFLCVTDDAGHLDRLRTVLDTPGRPLTIQNFVPHVTVGRWSGAYATGPLAELIAPFMNAAPLTITADAVELVEYAAADPRARLITKINIPLP